QQLQPTGRRRPAQLSALQNILDTLRLDLYPIHTSGNRGGRHIRYTYGRYPDDRKLISRRVRCDLATQEGPCRNAAPRISGNKINPYAALRISGNERAAELDCPHGRTAAMNAVVLLPRCNA